MITTNLDSIVKRTLLEKGYPMAYYAEYLFHAAACLRELNFDTLQIYNIANLPADSTGNVNLPDDFVEDIMLALPSGDKLMPIAKNFDLNPIRIHDSVTGAYTEYSTDANSTTFFGLPVIGWTWLYNVDSYGFPTGGFYGSPGGMAYGYQVIKSQRRIQVTSNMVSSSIVLVYVSDGQSADNATQIDPQAFQTIQDYIEWRCSPYASNEQSPPAQKYYNSRRKLRARLNQISITDIRQIIHNAYQASIKV